MDFLNVKGSCESLIKTWKFNQNWVLMNFQRCLFGACLADEEMWSSKLAKHTRLGVSSCPTYTHVGWWYTGAEGKGCIFLGYVQVVEGYGTNKNSFSIKISNNVTFNESLLFQNKSEGPIFERDLDGV